MRDKLRQELIVAVLIGVLLAGGWFLLCDWLSRLPVVSYVSLALAFQPWWRYWPVGLLLLLFPALCATMAEFLRCLLGVGTTPIQCEQVSVEDLCPRKAGLASK